jgi:hypothetical protein
MPRGAAVIPGPRGMTGTWSGTGGLQCRPGSLAQGHGSHPGPGPRMLL